MNKLNFDYLSFEMTRRCNLKCQHCMRGKAQNITITKEVIDAALNQVNFVSGLFFSGGEPLLAIDEIEYIIDSIIKKNIVLMNFGIITNGTILDARASHCLNKLSEYIINIHKSHKLKIPNITGTLQVSEDEFHMNDTSNASAFYKQNCDEKIDVCTKSLNIVEGRKLIAFCGNAKKNIDNSKYYYMFDIPQHRIQFSDINKKKDYGNNVRLCETESNEGIFIECPIEISANGNCGIICSSSFQDQDDDKNKIGNVLNGSIAEMIDNWQWKHPIYCKEVDLKNKAEANIINNRNNPNYNANNDNSMITDIDTIENKRKELHHNFMYLSFDEIYNMTEILIELGDAEKTNDLEKQDLCKKRYRKYERVNQEREIAEQFKGHEETHKKFPNLTPKECEIMDYSIKQINDDWSGYSDKKFVKECKEHHKVTIKDLQAKNDSRNTLSGLLKAFIQ